MFTEEQVRELIGSMHDSVNLLEEIRTRRRVIAQQQDYIEGELELLKAQLLEQAAQGNGGLGKNEEERKRRAAIVLAGNQTHVNLAVKLASNKNTLRELDDRLATELDRFSMHRNAARLIASMLNYMGGE